MELVFEEMLGDRDKLVVGRDNKTRRIARVRHSSVIPAIGEIVCVGDEHYRVVAYTWQMECDPAGDGYVRVFLRSWSVG